MEKTKKRVLLAGVFVLIAFFFLSGWESAQTAPIKIGVLVPLTGVYSVIGDRTIKGVEFAVDEVNKRGGVLGNKIEMVVADDETNPEVALRLTKRFITQDKVVAIFGPLHGGAAIAVSNEMKKQRAAIQFPWAAVEELTTIHCSPYTWRAGVSCSQKSRAGATLGAKSGFNNWATISSDFSYGRSVINEFVNYFRQIKPDVKFVSESWPKLGEEDFSPYINQILKSNPQALYVGLFGGDPIRFIKQAKPFGLFDKMRVYFDDTAHQSSLEALGDDTPFGHYSGARYYWRAPKNEKNDKFVKEFQARYKGMYPDTFSGEAYAAVYALVEGIKKAKSTDVEKLIKSLGGLEIDGPKGKIIMRAEDHQGAQVVYWGQYAKNPKYPFPVLENIIEFSGDAVTPPPKCGGP